MVTVKLLLRVVGPVIAACAVLLVAWRPWRRPVGTPDRERALGLTLVLGFLLAFAAQVGWDWSVSPARWHGMAGLAIAVAIIGAVADSLPLHRWTIVAWGALAGCTGALLIRMPGVDTYLLRAGLGLIILLLSVLTLPIAVRRTGSTLLSWAIVFATLSALLMTSRFAKLACMAGTPAGICAFAGLLVWSSGRACRGISESVLCGALIPTLALTGYAYDYGSVPVVSWLLAAGAITTAWAGDLVPIRLAPRWASEAVSTAAVAITCAIALLLALPTNDAAY